VRQDKPVRPHFVPSYQLPFESFSSLAAESLSTGLQPRLSCGRSAIVVAGSRPSLTARLDQRSPTQSFPCSRLAPIRRQTVDVCEKLWFAARPPDQAAKERLIEVPVGRPAILHRVFSEPIEPDENDFGRDVKDEVLKAEIAWLRARVADAPHRYRHNAARPVLRRDAAGDGGKPAQAIGAGSLQSPGTNGPGRAGIHSSELPRVQPISGIGAACPQLAASRSEAHPGIPPAQPWPRGSRSSPSRSAADGAKKSLTNLVRIISAEWRLWLRRGRVSEKRTPRPQEIQTSCQKSRERFQATAARCLTRRGSGQVAGTSK
jgi:hypothetical protein